MTSIKNTKRALLASVLSVALCCAMLIGSTFAWFTDSVTNTGNRIQAGNLEIDLLMDKEGTGNYTSIAGGKGDIFGEAGMAQNSNETLWEPGKTQIVYLGVQNRGNLALKYNILLDVTDNGLAGALEYAVLDGAKAEDLAGVKDWETLKAMEGAQTGDIAAGRTTAAPNGCLDEIVNGMEDETDYFALAVHMKKDAGNEYQGKDITIDVTVVATQATAEEDGFGNDQYDADAGEDTAFYTLSEFNALTEIPAGIKNVYLNIGDVSLADGDVTIGNKYICDMWTLDGNTDHYVGEILEDGRKVYMVRDNDTIYSSNKAGITLYISGSVKENPEGGLNQSDSHAITFSIPDASNVVFTKDFTVNGYFRMYTGWSDGRNLGGAFYNRTVKSVLFDRSTFNGIWIQNGGFFADSLTLDGCTFTAYENTASANDSNPLWFCNIRTCDVTVKNCTFKASRPIKVVEQGVYGADVTITGNTFDMSLPNSVDVTSEPRNDAIMFSTLIGETQWNPAGTLGNVVVSGNEVTGANALLTFFNPSQITMANGATFKVSDNILNGAKLSVEWKTATEYTPDFVK